MRRYSHIFSIEMGQLRVQEPPGAKLRHTFEVAFF
jgi:hypothetical protein